MRRSISYCQPSQARAGEINTWNFVYTPAVSLPKGAHLKFDLQSLGREIDWEIPSTNLKKASNVIYGLLPNGKVVAAKEVESDESFVPYFEFVLPADLPQGNSFTIVVGAPPESKAGDQKSGTRAQVTAQRRRLFRLFIDSSGKGRFDDPETFSLDVKGNALSNIRVLTPSFTMKNKRFDIVIRFEDAFGNLTSNAPEDTLIELSHEHLRENLKWKLFVPETGFITLPNLYFNEAGFYTITLYNTKTKEKFHSSPIMCFPENSKHLFWGLLHGESDKIDSTENIESCLRNFRDDQALNFYGTSPFESVEETPNELWKQISQNVSEFDETDRFVTFLGFQWQGIAKEEGVRLFVYSKDSKPILRKKEQKNSSLKKIYKSASPKEFISIPCFTMGKGFEYDFKDFDPNFERVVEIYNAWGSSECTKKEGNGRPILSHDKKGIQESSEGAIQKALQNNCRFGFVAGGLDDRGIYANLYDGDQEQYSPGLTAIISQDQSKSALFDALYNRSCYATTGERIIVGLYLAGSPMGSELNTAAKPGLLINRHVSGYVAGTCKLKTVELIRNGKVIKTFESNGYSIDFTYDDMEPMEHLAISSSAKEPPFVYYYLRATQEDGHIAWSSPIWVDLLPPTPKDASKRQGKVPAKKTLLEEAAEDDADDADDDDDFDDDYDDEDDDL